MDKDKLIDEILAEWAMRSPDGLVSGHDTPDNMAVLNEILSEYKYKVGGPLDPKFFKLDRKTGKFVATEKNPMYPVGTDRRDILNKTATPKPGFDQEDLSARPKKEYSGPEWSEDYLVDVKEFFPSSAKIIIRALDELDRSDRVEFLREKFDRLTADEAVKFLNSKGARYEGFLKALDAARVSKGTDEDDEGDASGSKAGRGEFILVLLIKGGTSAGSKSGDIILPDGSAIEVKEVKDAGETFRATKASFGGQFNHIPFIDALNELISFCVGNQEHIDALMELAIDAGIKNKSMPAQQVDAAGVPIKPRIEDIPEGAKMGELSALKKFLNTADINNLNSSTSYALEMLGIHIRSINETEAKNKVMDPDKVEFDIGKQASVLKVNEIPPEDLAKIRRPSEKPKEIQVTVSSIAQEKRKAELIVPRIKRLKLFSKADKDLQKMFTPLNIAQTMFKAMSTAPGHYTGGIIFWNSKTKVFKYEPNLTKLRHGQYYFKSYQQTGPTFTKQEPRE